MKRIPTYLTGLTYISIQCEFFLINSFCVVNMYLFLPVVVVLGVILYYVQKTPLNPVSLILEELNDLSSVTYSKVELIQKYELDRPEDLLVYHDDDVSETFFLTGIGTGRLVKVNMKSGESEVLLTPFDFQPSHFTDSPEMEDFCEGGMYQESRCGRILGLNFREKDKSKVLIVNAYFGIYEYDLSKHELKLFVETPDLFVNTIIELNGYIYYTVSHDSLMRYQFIYAALDGPSGSLYRFDPELSDIEPEPVELLDGLLFPNGIVPSEDGKSILVAETMRRSILKYELETGEITPFSTNLPFYPDNIHIDYKRNKLYTCGLRRNELGEKWVLPYPEVTKWLTRSPKFVHIPLILYFIFDDEGIGAEVDLGDGSVTKLIDPRDSKIFPFCSTLKKLEEEGEDEDVYISGSVLFGFASKFKMTKEEMELEAGKEKKKRSN